MNVIMDTLELEPQSRFHKAVKLLSGELTSQIQSTFLYLLEIYYGPIRTLMGEGSRYFRSDLEVNCGVVCLVSEGIIVWNQSHGQGMSTECGWHSGD